MLAPSVVVAGRSGSVTDLDTDYLFLVAILALELALALHHYLAVTANVHVLRVSRCIACQAITACRRWPSAPR